jgi:hypothetical protein
MPTPEYHLRNMVGEMIQSTSDRVAFVAAGVAGTAPLWKDSVRDISDIAAAIGPILAALVVVLKIILTAVQIWKTIRSKGSYPST